MLSEDLLARSWVEFCAPGQALEGRCMQLRRAPARKVAEVDHRRGNWGGRRVSRNCFARASFASFFLFQTKCIRGATCSKKKLLHISLSFDLFSEHSRPAAILPQESQVKNHTFDARRLETRTRADGPRVRRRRCREGSTTGNAFVVGVGVGGGGAVFVKTVRRRLKPRAETDPAFLARQTFVTSLTTRVANLQ